MGLEGFVAKIEEKADESGKAGKELVNVICELIEYNTVVKKKQFYKPYIIDYLVDFHGRECTISVEHDFHYKTIRVSGKTEFLRRYG